MKSVKCQDKIAFEGRTVHRPLYD